MEIATTGYILNIPPHFQHTTDVLTDTTLRHMIPSATAKKVVEFLFKTSDILAVMSSRDYNSSDKYAFCTCKGDIGVGMVGSGYSKCDQGR